MTEIDSVFVCLGFKCIFGNNAEHNSDGWIDSPLYTLKN